MIFKVRGQCPKWTPRKRLKCWKMRWNWDQWDLLWHILKEQDSFCKEKLKGRAIQVRMKNLQTEFFSCFYGWITRLHQLQLWETYFQTGFYIVMFCWRVKTCVYKRNQFLSFWDFLIWNFAWKSLFIPIIYVLCLQTCIATLKRHNKCERSW